MKTFPVRFMTNKNLFNLPRSKILTKIRHMYNFFLQTVTITNINIFGDLGSRKFQASNTLQFFKFFRGIPKFFFWNLPIQYFFQTLNLNHVICCVIDCVRYIKTLIVCPFKNIKYTFF